MLEANGLLGRGAAGPIIVRSRHSMKMECFHCHKLGQTTLHYVNGYTVYILCFWFILAGLFLVIPCFFACIPCCVKDWKDVRHECAECKTHIATTYACLGKK